MAEFIDWDLARWLPREHQLTMLIQELTATKRARLHFIDAAILIGQDSLRQLRHIQDPPDFLYTVELTAYCVANGLASLISENYVYFALDGSSPAYEDPGIAEPTSEPVIGAQPAVYAYSKDNWIFLFERPFSAGIWANNLEFKLENVGLGWTKNVMLGLVTAWIEPKQAFDVEVRYRWRNPYRDGGADGWSAYSSKTDAFGTASVTENDPYDSVVAFDNDPNDGSLAA